MILNVDETGCPEAVENCLSGTQFGGLIDGMKGGEIDERDVETV